MERVMITLPQDLLREVDQLAGQEGRKRSQLIQEVLRELIARRKEAEFQALLEEGYREMAGTLAELAEEAKGAQAAAAEGAWRWDD